MESKLTNLITEGHALARIKARSKKHALEILSEMLAEALPPDPASPDRLTLTNAVVEALVLREKLGSTGLGGGIALPHACVAKLDRMVGALITLDQPVDYETPDGQPVDVIMALVAPDPPIAEHREVLESTSRVLSGHTDECPLRAAQSSAELHAALACMDEAMSADSEIAKTD